MTEDPTRTDQGASRAGWVRSADATTTSSRCGLDEGFHGSCNHKQTLGQRTRSELTLLREHHRYVIPISLTTVLAGLRNINISGELSEIDQQLSTATFSIDRRPAPSFRGGGRISHSRKICGFDAKFVRPIPNAVPSSLSNRLGSFDLDLSPQPGNPRPKY